jgi:hypothetical protein
MALRANNSASERKGREPRAARDRPRAESGADRDKPRLGGSSVAEV